MNRTIVVKLLAVAITGWSSAFGVERTVVTFEDLTLSVSQAAPATADQSGPFYSHGVQFNRSWSTEFQCCPGGWAYSNQTDQKTAGYENSFSAVARATNGGGAQSTNFGVALNYFQGDARVDFPSPADVVGMFVTNVTYSYKAIVDGNDGAGFVKGPFVKGDFFRLDVIGIGAANNEIGRVPVYLADFRDTPRVIDDWTWVDLSPLGSGIARLEFQMESTDVGEFGMNTPAYFAIDSLTFQSAIRSLTGDFNNNATLDLADVNLLSQAIYGGSFSREFDLASDGVLDEADLQFWVADLRRTWFGDANLDGQFDSSDLVMAFQKGKYEHAIDASWEEGDWNANRRFDSGDMVSAFQNGGFERGPVAGIAATVPEPSSGLLMSSCLLLALLRPVRRVQIGNGCWEHHRCH